MDVIQQDGTQAILFVIIKTDNDGSNIKFVWTLNDVDNFYLNNGIIEGMEVVDPYQYVCNVLGLSIS